MKILLVSGGFHIILLEYLSKDIEVMNEYALSLKDLSDELRENRFVVDAVLLTEEALSQQLGQDQEDLRRFLEWFYSHNDSETPVILITKNHMRLQQFTYLIHRYQSLNIRICDAVRIPADMFRNSFDHITQKRHSAGIHKQNVIKPTEQMGRQHNITNQHSNYSNPHNDHPQYNYSNYNHPHNNQTQYNHPHYNHPHNDQTQHNHSHHNHSQHDQAQHNPTHQSLKKRSFLDRFRAKTPSQNALTPTDSLTKELNNISRGISRVVAITGHRGNGLTSTVVNLAEEASKRGLSAIIIDMDTEYRSTNMYFSRFHDMTKRNEDMNASLIRCLARPQDYMTTAFNIKDNFWLTALGYSFQDRKLMEQFYISEKLVGLISVLRNKFNLVLLDLPLDLLTVFKEVMIHIDVFGLCIPNNLHAVLSTIRNVEVRLDEEKASYLNAKAKVIVTKYNDRSRFQGGLFTPDKVSELLTSGLSNSFRYDMGLAGSVPYSAEFDTQIESDIAATNSGAQYEKAFGQMLLRLMEGA